MSPVDDVSNIADASRPNAGRIYDYLLGGSHNFEIDRQAAEQLKKMVPEMPQWVRLIRWFMGEAVRRLLDEGFTKFLDFASGLPTVDHIHQIAPAGTKVIYSDIDPVTVAYSKDIVKDLPDIRYVECDIKQPEKLLESGVIQELFGDNKKVTIGVSGIAWFLPDDSVSHALNVLYDWAGEGSKLLISDMDTKEITEAGGGGLEFYKKVGQPVYPRPNEKLIELIGKWKVLDPGFLPLTDWVKMDKSTMEKGSARMGGGNIVGAILTK